MAGTGMLNFFRVLIQGGYLTELRVEDPLFEPEADGISMIWISKNDGFAGHRSLYLSLFGEDFKAGEGRRTQLRMIIGDYGSNPEKHKELYQTFLKDVESKPRSFSINPANLEGF